METYCILSQVLLDNICISEYYEHISFFFIMLELSGDLCEGLG